MDLRALVELNLSSLPTLKTGSKLLRGTEIRLPRPGTEAAPDPVAVSPDGVRCTTGRPHCPCLTGRTRPVDRVNRSTNAVLDTFCSVADAARKNSPQVVVSQAMRAVNV